MKLDVGSAIVLYTGGLVEASRDYFKGVQNLQEAIEKEYLNASDNIAEAIQRRVFAQHPPRDDSALLFMGITALGTPALEPARLTWRVDARVEKPARRVKRALLWHLGEIAAKGPDLSGSELVIGELLGNLARHTPGPAEVALEWKHDIATVCVTDQGARFDVRLDNDVGDLLSESGRGLFLLRTITHEFTVQWTGAGNRISAVLPLEIHTHGTAFTQTAPVSA